MEAAALGGLDEADLVVGVGVAEGFFDGLERGGVALGERGGDGGIALWWDETVDGCIFAGFQECAEVAGDGDGREVAGLGDGGDVEAVAEEGQGGFDGEGSRGIGSSTAARRAAPWGVYGAVVGGNVLDRIVMCAIGVEWGVTGG